MWALMYIVDVVHKQDVLHNDLNPNNVMLHFPRDRVGAVFIGICDKVIFIKMRQNHNFET